MILAIAFLLLPSVFWDKTPQSVIDLVRNGVKSIVVPPNLAAAWKAHSAVTVTAADVATFEKLPAPGISFRAEVASPTREPWVNSNGWHYLRQPNGRFFYDAPGGSAALAAAEAFTFGGETLIKTDDAGLPSLARMLNFLGGIEQEKMQPVADIAFVDDGSSLSAECMNLLIRRNLLVTTNSSASPGQAMRVVLGSPQYPRKDAANPVVFAQEVREHLTDEKRSLRIYGTDVVVGRLATDASKTRVFLLNYGSGKYSIEGIRVRVLGHYSKMQVFDSEGNNKVTDTALGSDAAEFTLPKLKTFEIVDLYR